MINYVHAVKVFNDYVKDYDLNDANIKLKYVHTFQVVRVMEYLCEKLNLNEEETNIAKLIALLHDFGRFEQWRQYHSFLDYKTIDHAEFSSDLLFKENYIRNFVEDDQYDDIIKASIEQHNKYKVDATFDDITLLFIHLIRDADKLDNYRVKESEKIETLLFVTLEELNNQTISPHIYDSMMKHELIVSSSRVTELDFWLSYMAFTYDLYFNESLQYIQDENYIERCCKRVMPTTNDTLTQYNNIVKELQNYVSSRTNHK